MLWTFARFTRHRVTWLVALLSSAVLHTSLPAHPAAAAQHSARAWATSAPAVSAPHAQELPQHVSVVVELTAPPAAALVTRRPDAAPDPAAQARVTRTHIAQLDQAQRQLLPILAQRQAQVLYRTQRVYNGIAVRLPPAQVAALARLPGVRAIHPLRPVQRVRSQSVPLIGAPSVWSHPTGAITGTGVTIASIDTGIDYTHADFGGPGTPAAYQANDATIIEPGSFPTPKVIGGYDFAGDAYDPDSDDPAHAPQPDPDPLDCAIDGHGTHVAGIAAGFGVTAAGTTYPGPYTSSTPIAELALGPGVAPGARLYAYRIFGCTAATELALPALEAAVDPNGDGDLSDHSDIIMAEFATDIGLPDDPTTVAADHATRLGAQVVAAQGNAGDTTFAGASPGNAPGAITVAATTTSDTVAAFSARGPMLGAAGLKPDLAAPGVSIRSAAVGTGSGAVALSGTSMALPHVAGSLALLTQLHPTWSAAERKALLLNTATHDVRLSSSPSAPVISPVRVGAGRVDVAQAAASDVIAFNRDAPAQVSVAFGLLALTTTATLTQAITLANKGTQSDTATLAYQPVTTIPGVTYTLDQEQVVVPAGATATVAVTLHAVWDALQHSRDPALAPTQDGQSRHWLSEAAGYVVVDLALDAAPTLRVPVYAAVRPAAQMTAVVTSTPWSPTATVVLTGTGFGPGLGSSTLPTTPQSLASVYELQAVSPPRPTTRPPHPADLAAIGIAQTPDQLVFGLGTHVPWMTPTPALVRFDILLDTDGSGITADGRGAEYVLRTTDRGTRQGQAPTDVFEAVLTNRQTQTSTVVGLLNLLPPSTVDTAIFSSTVVAIPLPLAALDLSAGPPQLSYRVQTFGSVAGSSGVQPIDDSGTLRYDLAAPHATLLKGYQGLPLVNDQPGTTLTVPTDPTRPAPTLLLLHHHNLPGQQIAILPLSANQQYLPLVVRP